MHALYSSYYASASFPAGPPRLVPPLKRPRLMVPPARPVIKAPVAPKQQPLTPINQLKTYSNPDILICGNCRELFTELQELLDHKKTYCKLRFTCKCHTLNGVKTKSGGEELTSAMLLCVMCKDCFHSPWDLMVHVQAAHMMNIYELGLPKADNGVKGDDQASPAASPSPRSSDDKEKHDGQERDDTPTPDEDDDADEYNMASPEQDKEEDANGKESHDATAQVGIMHTISLEHPTLNKKKSPAEKASVKVSITNGDISTQE